MFNISCLKSQAFMWDYDFFNKFFQRVIFSTNSFFNEQLFQRVVFSIIALHVFATKWLIDLSIDIFVAVIKLFMKLILWDDLLRTTTMNVNNMIKWNIFKTACWIVKYQIAISNRLIKCFQINIFFSQN